MRVEDILALNARKFPSREVLVAKAGRLTYRGIDNRTSRLANALSAAGLTAGDRVAVILPNSLEFVEVMFAAAKAGAALVPINPKLSWAEIEYILKDSKPDLIVGTAERFHESSKLEELRIRLNADFWDTGKGGPAAGTSMQYAEVVSSASPEWREPPQKADLDTWLIAYTSGTTGRPKGVLLSHRSKTLCAWIEALEFGTRGGDRALINTPLFHAHALVHLLSLVSVGGTVILSQGFDPSETFQWIQNEYVTELSMVPTMYQGLLDHLPQNQMDLSSMRVARCTGAPLSSKLKGEIVDHFPDWEVHVFYGATEAGPVSNLRPENLLTKDGSVGQPFLGVEVEVRDEHGMSLPPGTSGEVFIKSPYICSGYWDDPTPSRDGEYERWITLGDLGFLDSDGFLFLQGRKKDVIISGGETISAKEVEEVLSSHESVRAAAIVGVSDRYWGERIVAFVELEPERSLSSEQLLNYCDGRLAGFKQPKQVEFVEMLPRNAMGKVDKRRLVAKVGTSQVRTGESMS